MDCDKIIKKTIYIFIIFLIAGNMQMTICEASDNNDNEDIEIRIQSLKDRQYGSQALTDGYGIEILTPFSTGQQAEIAKTKQEELIILSNSLFIDGYVQTDKERRITLDAAKYGLFLNNYNAKNTTSLKVDVEIAKNVLVFGAVICIMLGFLLARGWNRLKRKKG